jgi:hypothetical protein
MNEEDISEIEAEQDESLTLKYNITSYGADFDVDGLVRQFKKGGFYVPNYQRGYVWDLKQASRFIESLLLGLPVPGIFLSREKNSQKFLVIDGQQRLKTLVNYYRGFFNEKEFALTGIDPRSRFNGKKYDNLEPEDKRRLNDSIIHATIIKQDELDDGDTSIYFVFERLNTGDTQLQPQEIRSAVYHGKFNELVVKLNGNRNWRSLYGSPPNTRGRDQELILRFFALYYTGDKYTKPMTEFLNLYMGKNRQLKIYSEENLTEVFEKTVSTINKLLGTKAFRRKTALNAAIFDSVMVGIARRLQNGEIKDGVQLQKKHEELLNNQDYIIVTEQATSNEENVRRRIELATEAFAQVP